MEPEVFQRAVQNFKPLVFSLISETPENVNLERILEGVKKEEALQESLLIIDARLCVRDFLSTKIQNGKGNKSASDAKKSHVQVDMAKSPAAFIREEFTKISLSREYQRMAAVKEREDYLRALQAQYVEDGMTEDEALRAAEEDVKDDGDNGAEVDILEPDSAMGNNAEKIKRIPLYLCLLGFPNTIEDLLDCASNGVPLNCLLNIISKAPTPGSIAMESMEKPMEKSRFKANEVSKSAGKRAKPTEDDGAKHFFQDVLHQKEQQRKIEDYNALNEVLVHTYEFPVEALPPRVTDGPQSYRLIGSEKSGFHAIVEALAEIEESLWLFSEWKSERVVVHVPRYVGLPDPDAPKPVPVEVVEEKSKKAGRTASKKGIQPPPEPVVQAPALTTEDLRSMSDVAVCREQYDSEMHQQCINNESFSTSLFVKSCIAQVSMSPTSLADKDAKAEKEMIKKKEEVGRFADFIFDEIMGEINFYLPSEGVGSENNFDTLEVFREEKKRLPNMGEKDLDSSIAVAKETPEVPLSNELSRETANNRKEWDIFSIGKVLGVEGRDISEVISVESLRDIILAGIKSINPFLSGDIVRELVEKATFLGFAAINHSQLSSSFARFWLYKNMLGWRPFSRMWNKFVVDVLSKGDGSPRTQQLLFSFDGPTTFPDFFNEQKFCDVEKLFFYPPAAESDDELEVEHEENEEEEEEEDDEGNVIPRKKKEIELQPFLDHVSIIQRAMRRRRIYEAVRRHLDSPSNQETVNHGLGTRHGSEEVEWMFPMDGAVIEVERSVVNTKQVHCLISPPRGLEFGFVAEEACRTAEDATLESVPSCIRSFVDVGRIVQVRTAVVADNSVEAEKTAYEKSVEEAKVEAKRQFEALQVAKKSAKGKDKGAMLPTLQELEQGCINGIIKPQNREKCPPTLQICALFYKGSVAVSFNELEEYLVVKPSRPPQNVNLPIRVWRNNQVDTIVLHSISYVIAQVDFIELFSPQSQGYRVLLCRSGAYTTEKDNQSLVVTSEGNCSLRSVEGITVLPAQQYFKNVDPSTTNVVIEREDRVKIIYQSENKTCIHFGCNVCVRKDGKECNWTVPGLPIIRSNAEDRIIGIDAGLSVLRFDLLKNVLYLTCPDEEYYAVIDWIDYRAHVVPIDRTSAYTIDCAFGGIYGEVFSPISGSGEEQRKKIYRVSPFGRCSEEQDGLLVLPERYTTPARQPLMRVLEIWEPSFVETLRGSDVCVEHDALHLMEGLTSKHMLELPAHIKVCNVAAPQKTIERFYALQGLESLKGIMSSDERDRRVLTCTAICTCDRSFLVVFMEPSSASLVLKTFLRTFHSLYSCPFEVDPANSGTKEYLMAVKAPQLDTSQSSKVLLPSTVTDLFRSKSSVSKALLFWYWLLRSTAGSTLDSSFFNVFFDHKRLDRGYQDALAFLSLNLPLAQREYLFSHCKAAKNLKLEPIMNTGGVVEPPRATVCDQEAIKHVFPPKENGPFPSKPKMESKGWNDYGRLDYWKFFTNEIPFLEMQESGLSSFKKDANCHEEYYVGGPSTRKVATLSFHAANPLMLSKSGHNELNTGTTSAARNHHPVLSCYPELVDFGSIKAQRCYATMIYVTNTSTVPCRYRVVVPEAFRSFSSVRYPRHFVAPGLTEGVEVRISGRQPVGMLEMHLLLAHEGGSRTLIVKWNTVESETSVSLSPYTLCLGNTHAEFVPGVTSRFKRRKSDEIIFDEENNDDDDSSVDEVDNNIVEQ